MASGSKGMGMHKHYISGKGGPSPRTKLNRMLEANKELAKAKKKKTKMYSTVKDAFKG